MPTNLISRVQDSINSQRSSFCSRATSVTPIGDNRINLQDIVSYVDCNGNTTTVPYIDIQSNNGYIDDCVQGGCSIKSVSDMSPNKYFVQFGTTDCETPPPSDNLLFTECNSGKTYVVPSTNYKFNIDNVYDMILGSDIQSCFTFNGITIAELNNTISVVNSGFLDCGSCGGPTPTVPIPSPPTPTLPTPTPMIISYIVGDTSYGFQPDACASSGGGTITVYSNSPLMVNSTFLYTDSLLTTPYSSNGFVYLSGKGNYVLSTGLDGKLTSLAPCT